MKTLAWTWSSPRAPHCRARQGCDIPSWSQGCLCLNVFPRFLQCLTLPCRCLLPWPQGRGDDFLTRQLVAVPGTGHLFLLAEPSLNLTMSHSARLKHPTAAGLRHRCSALMGVPEGHRQLMAWSPFQVSSGRTSRPRQSQGSLVSCSWMASWL